MLMIRLARIGKKKQPHYRLVVSEKARDMYGKALEIVGNYNPRTKEINLNPERIKHWLAMGAQTSDSVHNLLVSNKIIESKKRSVTAISNKRKEKIAKKNEKTEQKEDKKEEQKQPETEEKPSQTPAKEVVEEKEKVQTKEEVKVEEQTENKE